MNAWRWWLLIAPVVPAAAHVPFIEGRDFPESENFRVENVTQSKAMYAWLDSEKDVDQYVMQLEKSTRVYLRTSIPYCTEYSGFSVTYALTGPGLPAPEVELPIELPEGHGAFVIRDEFESTAERSVMYEPFSARMYWNGNVKSLTVEEPGEYSMVVWNEQGQTGDYLAVIGRAERFSREDMRRAVTNVPIINKGKELHVECPDLALTADREPIFMAW